MGLIITPGGTLPEYSTTSPANVGSGAFPFARKRTGQTLLSSMGLIGAADTYQPHLGFKRLMIFETLVNSISGSTLGLAANTATGTPGARAWAATNFLSQSRRIGYATTSAAAGLAAGFRMATPIIWRGNAAGFGGFYLVLKFGVPTIPAGAIMFFGVSPGTAIAATTAASAGVNIIGVGKDTADTNWQVMYNDASGTATKVDTGVAPDSTTAYALRILCIPNDTSMYISLENLATGAVINDSTAITNLPDNATLLGYNFHIANNATAASAGVDVLSVYIHSD